MLHARIVLSPLYSNLNFNVSPGGIPAEYLHFNIVYPAITEIVGVVIGNGYFILVTEPGTYDTPGGIRIINVSTEPLELGPVLRADTSITELL